MKTLCDKIIHGDCIEEMAKMDAGSVNLTVTSPPYDNLRTYEGSLQWHEGIWKQVLEGLYRVTNKGGVVVWVVNDATIKGSETGTSFKQALYAMECGFNLHDTMIWLKDGGGAVGSNKCYVQNFEYMFILTKGKVSTVNRIKDVPNGSFGKNKSGVGRRRPDGSHKIEERKPCAEYKFRNNYWYQPPERGTHPAVFPFKLAADHIRSWSNEGDTIFDPFLGSGTTGAAAQQLNRNFIGIEKVEKYYDIAQERLGITLKLKAL
jgi:site-specific DNA-methyltransferase (adenine-specific)